MKSVPKKPKNVEMSLKNNPKRNRRPVSAGQNKKRKITQVGANASKVNKKANRVKGGRQATKKILRIYVDPALVNRTKICQKLQNLNHILCEILSKDVDVCVVENRTRRRPLHSADSSQKSIRSASRAGGIGAANNNRSVDPRRHKNSRRKEILTFIKDTMKAKSIVDICKDLGVTMYLRKQIEKWIAEEEIKRSSNFGANLKGTSVTDSGVNIDNIPGSVPFLLVSDQTGHFDDMIKFFHPKDGKSTVPMVRIASGSHRSGFTTEYERAQTSCRQTRHRGSSSLNKHDRMGGGAAPRVRLGDEFGPPAPRRFRTSIAPVAELFRKTRGILEGGGYCECCGVVYHDYQKHCKSIQHRNFMADPRNFRELDAFVEEMTSHWKDTS